MADSDKILIAITEARAEVESLKQLFTERLSGQDKSIRQLIELEQWKSKSIESRSINNEQSLKAFHRRLDEFPTTANILALEDELKQALASLDSRVTTLADDRLILQTQINTVFKVIKAQAAILSFIVLGAGATILRALF